MQNHEVNRIPLVTHRAFAKFATEPERRYPGPPRQRRQDRCVRIVGKKIIPRHQHR